MSQHDQRLRRASRTRAQLNRVPLWGRLVVGLLGLTLLALAASSAATVTALRGYLLGRVDHQIEQVAMTLHRRGVHVPPKNSSHRAALPSAFIVQVRGPKGALVTQLRASLGHNVPAPAIASLSLSAVRARAGQPFTVAGVGAPDTHWRVVAVVLPGQRDTAFVATDLADVQHTVAQLVRIELAIGVATLLLLAGATYAIVRAGLRPLTAIEETARSIAAGDLSQRVPEHHKATELGRLATALNTMLVQLEELVRAREASQARAVASEARMRRFVSDASHELRTPLTSIRGFAELYRHGAVPSSQVASTFARIEEQSGRMSVLVDDLLLLARLDQQRPMVWDLVALNALLTDIVAEVRVAAPERCIMLALPQTPVVVCGDELHLRQLFGNLLGNALVHTPREAIVTVHLAAQCGDRCACIDVCDTGPGIAKEHVERIFERFYRADPARGRPRGGSGLGLAIVAAIAEAHAGRVEVITTIGVATIFRCQLPLVAPLGAAPLGGDDRAEEVDRPASADGSSADAGRVHETRTKGFTATSQVRPREIQAPKLMLNSEHLASRELPLQATTGQHLDSEHDIESPEGTQRVGKRRRNG